MMITLYTVFGLVPGAQFAVSDTFEVYEDALELAGQLAHAGATVEITTFDYEETDEDV